MTRKRPSLLDREYVERAYPGGGFNYIKPSQLGAASGHMGVALDRHAAQFNDMASNDPDGIIRLGSMSPLFEGDQSHSAFEFRKTREILKLGRELARVGIERMQKLLPRSKTEK